MKKLHAFLFAFLLLFSLASASRVLSRLEFTVVNSSETGAAAVYNPDLNYSTNCARTESIENEKFLSIRSGMSSAFSISHLGTATTVFLRAEIDDSTSILYIKPRGARCYYWLKISTSRFPEFTQPHISYVPRGISRGGIIFEGGRIGDRFVPLSVNLFEKHSQQIGERRQEMEGDIFAVLLNGSSQNQDLRITPIRNNQIQYGSWSWMHEDGEGGAPGRGAQGMGVSPQPAPITTRSGSLFRSISESIAIFSMFVHNQ